MNIEDTLKSPDIYDVRLVCGDAWMYWDETNMEWCVLMSKRNARRASVLYKGSDISEALQALTRDNT